MNIAKARDYFQLGVITSFDAVRDVDPGRWILSISGNQGQAWTLETSSKKIKTFVSMDTLLADVESITGRVQGASIKV